MEHKINLNRTSQDFYQDNSGEYSYKGEFITFNINGLPDKDLIETIEKEIENFKKLCKRNPKIYIQKEIRADWATFSYFVTKYKVSPMRPNSCFYCTFEFAARRGKLSIVSPTINFDYNCFKTDRDGVH